MSHPVEGMLNVSMEKLREMVDVDTVIGKPINSPDGLVTIIPVSKVSFGFGSGGTDIPLTKNSTEPFGGGAGAGVSDSSKGVSKLVESVPEVFSKVAGIFKSKKDKTTKQDEKK